MQKRRLSDIVTGDETWTHYFEPQRIVDNNMWLTKKGKRPVKAKRTFHTYFVFKVKVLQVKLLLQKADKSPDMYWAFFIQKMKTIFKNQ